MQITIDVEKVEGLFLKQEIGNGKIGKEPVSIGIALPTGTPYVHVRGEYYSVPNIYEAMIRAVDEQEEGDAKEG